MTENEEKEWIKYLGNKNLPYDRSSKSRKLACDIAIQALEKVQKFEAIGTVEEFKALKEKSVAKKPLHQGFVFACPCCNDKATIGSVFLRPNQKYCIDCGTEFDWQ